jgi:aspartate kinase
MTAARTDLVVMKFGGTSVEDAIAMERTAAIVAGRRERGLKAVTVVSAMAKVTDLLIASGAAAGRGDRSGALEISERLRARHNATAEHLLERERFARIKLAIDAEFNALDDLLRGIAAVGELTPRTADLVVSFGERRSTNAGCRAYMWMLGRASSRTATTARRCRRRRRSRPS